jgi:hypothetical protein
MQYRRSLCRVPTAGSEEKPGRAVLFKVVYDMVIDTAVNSPLREILIGIAPLRTNRQP